MDRRAFVHTFTLALLVAPLVGESQQTNKKTPRIGFLGYYPPDTSPRVAVRLDAFRRGLGDLGYVEGQNLLIEYRWAEGRLDELPRLAGELVRLKVDLIVAEFTVATLAAKQATQTIPIVMTGSIDPVPQGIIASLARPGGNVTGMAGQLSEMAGKRLELLKEVVPTTSRVAVLWNPAFRPLAYTLKATEAAAPRLGMQLSVVEVRSPDDFGRVFGTIREGHATALFLIEDPLIDTHRRQIADLAIKNKLPSMGAFREWPEAGGLVAYCVWNTSESYRRVATFVDRILKGAKPADLPAEQATKFELVINLKTAKALGLTIPPSLLIRADELIQ